MRGEAARPAEQAEGRNLPEHVVGHDGRRPLDVLALQGDKADNVPGVADVGPKTAMDWIKKYGDIDKLYAHADEIKGKRGDSLRNSKEMAYLSRELVTINTDSPVDLEKDKFALSEPDKDALIKIFKELGFTRLLTQFGANIKTRIGLHHATEAGCDPAGVILIETAGGLLGQIASAPAGDFRGAEVKDHGAHRARQILAAGLDKLGLGADTLPGLRKGAEAKAIIALAIRRETTVPLAWIANELSMGSTSNVSAACTKMEAMAAGRGRLRRLLVGIYSRIAD